MTKAANNVPVMKLKETHADERGRSSDTMAMFRIWSLLTGADMLRDQTVGNRTIR
jgi:hypothetical protein